MINICIPCFLLASSDKRYFGNISRYFCPYIQEGRGDKFGYDKLGYSLILQILANIKLGLTSTHCK